VNHLQSCGALKKLSFSCRVKDAHIRGLEHIPTLEVLNVDLCTVTNVSCLRSCRALKKLSLSCNVTDAHEGGNPHKRAWLTAVTMDDLSSACHLPVICLSSAGHKVLFWTVGAGAKKSRFPPLTYPRS
jgi:hypothetical protein